MNKYKLSQEQFNDCVDLIDDMVSVYCDENTISGENAWTIVNALSEVRMKQFPDHPEFNVDFKHD